MSSQIYNSQSQTQSYIEDPYLPYQIDSYLNSLSDWRNIQDIIRLCFKSLTETVRNQGMALKEMEKAISSKCSKGDLSASLNTKANSTEVMRAMSDLTTSLESRPTIDEIRQMLNDKISKSELIYYLNSKPSTEEVRTMLEAKVDSFEFSTEINEMNQKIEEFGKDFSKKVPLFASAKDISIIQKALEQKANLSEMTEILNTKANKDSVVAALQKKANKTEVDLALANKVEKNEFNNLSGTLATKANQEQVDSLEKLMEEKVDSVMFETYIDKLNGKAEVNDFKLISDAFQEMKGSMTKRIDDIDQDLDRLIDNIKTQFQSLNVVINNLENNKVDYSNFEKMGISVSKKIDTEKFDSLINKVKNELFEVINDFKTEVEKNRKKTDEKINEKVSQMNADTKNALNEIASQKENLSKFLSEKKNENENMNMAIKKVFNNSFQDFQKEILSIKADVDEFKSAYTKELTKKVDFRMVNENIDKIESELKTKTDIDTIESNLATQFSQLELKIEKELTKRVTLNELNAAISDKITKNNLDSKVDISAFEKLKKLYENLAIEISTKLDNEKYENSFKAVLKQLDDIVVNVNNKVNVKELLALLKKKAEIDDVNKALTSIHEELDTKCPNEEFLSRMDNQAIINDALCNENCVGRWFWKTGKVKNGYAVPWETQGSNTAPDNFIWEKDKTSIQTSVGGLYEINLGFFCEKKPAVQVMVNGEVAMSATNGGNFVVHGGSGRFKGSSRTSSRNVTGVTMVDYIMVPDNAKIAISYSGEDGAVGFLGLKKL